METFLAPLANSATMAIDCRWEDESERERTGHTPSYAETKKIKLLTLHTHGLSSMLF